jgi:SPW repeat
VSLPPGAVLDRRPRGLASEPSLPAAITGLWVVLGPWIWGYDDVDGAVLAAATGGGAIIVLSLASIVFPALWGLAAVAGSWLWVAPWIVGYGDSHGPVGLSDTLAGVLVVALAVRGMAVARSALRRGASGSQAVGRLVRHERER